MKFSETYDVTARTAKQQPRCIVILMDGTWNDETGKDGDGVVTNIVKLFRCIESDSDTQIVRYFRGVGNDEENAWLGIQRGGAFGRNEKKIREHAYATIMKEYHPGDKIFIFGFSRGAASARILASDLKRLGVPERLTIEMGPKQNRYSHHIENRFLSHETEGTLQPEVEVEFLGCWDTVGAFGIPVSLLGIPFQKLNMFKDMHVSENVNRAVHLVSIDETRKAFVPTLMNKRPGVVEELWFPGVHADVGGGYEHDQPGRTSLRYMINRLQKHLASLPGFELRFDQVVCKQHLESRGETRFHFHGLGYKKAIRDIYVQEDGRPNGEKPSIHSSVVSLQNDHEVYSVVRQRKGMFRKRPSRLAHIIYNPINVKALFREFLRRD